MLVFLLKIKEINEVLVIYTCTTQIFMSSVLFIQKDTGLIKVCRLKLSQLLKTIYNDTEKCKTKYTANTPSPKQPVQNKIK